MYISWYIVSDPDYRMIKCGSKKKYIAHPCTYMLWRTTRCLHWSIICRRRLRNYCTKWLWLLNTISGITKFFQRTPSYFVSQHPPQNNLIISKMESVVELEGGWLSLRCEEATPAIFPICQKYWGLVVLFYMTWSLSSKIYENGQIYDLKKGIPGRSWTLAVKLLESDR